MEKILITIVLLFIVGWLVLSFGEVVADVLRPVINWLLRKTGLQQEPIVTDRINSLRSNIIGQNAVVLHGGERGRFRVKAAQIEWWARTENERAIEEGVVVLIIGVEGNTLVVEPKSHGSA
jgi:membrane protein implicated in regulation of membrane protease activity